MSQVDFLPQSVALQRSGEARGALVRPSDGHGKGNGGSSSFSRSDDASILTRSSKGPGSLTSTEASSLSLRWDDDILDTESIDFPPFPSYSSGTSSDIDHSDVPPPYGFVEPESDLQEKYPVFADDSALKPEVLRHVDYLSHDWVEEDIWSSWNYIVSKRKVYGNSSRLENAIWRTWAKQKDNLQTVHPDMLNWLKDCDVTWLYGPLQTSRKFAAAGPVTNPTDIPLGISSFINKKPILKKQRMSEVMLQKSISSSSLVQRAAAAAQSELEQPSSSNRNRRDSSPVDWQLDDDHSSQWTLEATTPEFRETRHIRFDDRVEQCIAVDNKATEDDSENGGVPYPKYDSDTSSDNVRVRNKKFWESARNSKSKTTAHITPTNSREGMNPTGNKTIEQLPPTILKYERDHPDIPYDSSPVTGTSPWDSTGKLSPSPSQATLKPERSSKNFVLDDKDYEESCHKPWSTSSTDLEHSDEAMRRAEDDIYIIDGKEEKARNRGVMGRVVDKIDTEKYMIYLVSSTGWTSPEKMVKIRYAGRGSCLQTLEGHCGYVESVAFSHDSARLASASWDNTIKIWDAGSGACLQTLKGHHSVVTSIAFSHDSAWLASASWDKTIKIWDAGSGAFLQTLKGHCGFIKSVAFSHDSTWLASASEDKTIKIWDAGSGACLQTLEGHHSIVESVAFSHDSTWLASASWDKKIKIWDVGSGACLQTLKGHHSVVTSIAFSHDSTWLASASWDETIKIWDAGSGACLQTLKGHCGFIKSVAFSHDSAWLASASWDKTIKIWDAGSGACLQTLEGHCGFIKSVAFSHDSARLASASWDKTIKIWDAGSGASLQANYKIAASEEDTREHNQFRTALDLSKPDLKSSEKLENEAQTERNKLHHPWSKQTSISDIPKAGMIINIPTKKHVAIQTSHEDTTSPIKDPPLKIIDITDETISLLESEQITKNWRSTGWEADHRKDEDPMTPLIENEDVTSPDESNRIGATAHNCAEGGGSFEDSDETGTDQSIDDISRIKLKAVLLNYAMHEFFALFTTCPTGQSNSSDNSGSLDGKQNEESGQSKRNSRTDCGRGKRKATDKDSTDPDSDDEGVPKKKRPLEARYRKKDVRLKLACPYFQRDVRLCSKGACFGPGWDTVHRVKLPINCPRCGSEFESESDRDIHLRSDDRCIKQNLPPQVGVTVEQERILLGQRNKQRGQVEADKWRELYRFLFPDVDANKIPSPYYDYKCQFGSPADATGVIRDLETYISREMPALVQEELDRRLDTELQPAVERFVSQVPEIFRQVYERLIQNFRDTYNERTPVTTGQDRDPLAQLNPTVEEQNSETSGEQQQQEVNTASSFLEPSLQNPNHNDAQHSLDFDAQIAAWQPPPPLIGDVFTNNFAFEEYALDFDPLAEPFVDSGYGSVTDLKMNSGQAAREDSYWTNDV